MSTYTFREKVDLNELATRIVNTSDYYDICDVYGSESDAIESITSDLVNSPLTIISALVDMIEELQAEV
jgi:hypothetical protein